MRVEVENRGGRHGFERLSEKELKRSRNRVIKEVSKRAVPNMKEYSERHRLDRSAFETTHMGKPVVSCPWSRVVGPHGQCENHHT